MRTADCAARPPWHPLAFACGFRKTTADSFREPAFVLSTTLARLDERVQIRSVHQHSPQCPARAFPLARSQRRQLDHRYEALQDVVPGRPETTTQVLSRLTHVQQPRRDTLRLRLRMSGRIRCFSRALPVPGRRGLHRTSLHVQIVGLRWPPSGWPLVLKRQDGRASRNGRESSDNCPHDCP